MTFKDLLHPAQDNNKDSLKQLKTSRSGQSVSSKGLQD